MSIKNENRKEDSVRSASVTKSRHVSNKSAQADYNDNTSSILDKAIAKSVRHSRVLKGASSTFSMRRHTDAVSGTTRSTLR